MTDEGAVVPPATPSATGTVAREDTIATEVGRQQQPSGEVGEEREVAGVKNNSDDGDGGASGVSAVAPSSETEILEGGRSTDPPAAAAQEEGEAPAGSKRPPRVGSVRQGRKEKRRAGWEAKKALIKEKKKAEREKREEAMRKEGLEIPTAGTDYRALPKEQWSVSQRIRDAKRQEFEALSKGGGYRVCFDMAFDELMLEKAQASLVQQVLYAYGSNRKAAQPCRMTLSGMRPVMTKKVNKLQGFDTWLGVTTDSRCYTEIFDKEELVYLSADAPRTITQLQKDKVYIIGGLVDRNSHKRLCYYKALEQGVKAFKLPLKQESLHGSHSKVLATNHVFDILLRAMAAGGDLEKIETEALPPRKRAGWTGGDDRGPSSKPVSQQTDAEDLSDRKLEDASGGKSSSIADKNSEEKFDQSCADASGEVAAMGEGAVETAGVVKVEEGAMAAGSADVEKSGDGRAKVIGAKEGEEKKSGVKAPVVDGNGDGLAAGYISNETCGVVGVDNGETAVPPKRVEGENGKGKKRAMEKSGEGNSPNAESKRRKAETKGDGLE